MLCTKCGHVNPDSARFCSQCGNLLPPPGPTPPPSAPPTDKAPPGGQSSGAHTRQPDAAGGPTPEQTANKKEEAGRSFNDPPYSKAGQANPAAEETQNKQMLWLIIAIGALAIAGLANWLHSLYRDAWEVSLSLPPTQSQRPVASAPPSPLPPLPSTTPAARTSVPPAESSAVPKMPATAAPASDTQRKRKTKSATEVHLSEAQMKQLIARLQSGATPASCDSAIAVVKQQAHLSQAQATEAALHAYPALCAPVAKAEPEPPPRKVTRTVDQVWQERVASECESGLSGVICGEKLRYKLCEGRWTAKPPAGQKICHQPENNLQN